MFIVSDEHLRKRLFISFQAEKLEKKISVLAANDTEPKICRLYFIESLTIQRIIQTVFLVFVCVCLFLLIQRSTCILSSFLQM